MSSGAHGRRHRRAGVSLVILAVVLACGVLAVPAFGFVSRGTTRIVVPKLATATAKAACPAGEHVSFGGVMSELVGPVTPTNSKARIVLTTGEHRLATNARVLTASAVNPRDAGARYTAIAYCDRGAVPTVVSKTVRLGAYSAALAQASCPAGTVGVGGGFASGSGPRNEGALGLLAMDSPSVLDVGMVNLANVTTTLTALVSCAAGTAPTQHETSVRIAAHKSGTAVVNCPSGTKLVWGGLDSSPPSGSVSLTSAVIPTSWYAPTATQWRVTGYSAGTKPATLYAEAYCL